MDNLISTNTTAKYGLFMVGGIGGGIILLILQALPWVFGVAASILLLIVGLVVLYSKTVENKIPGIICTAAGAMMILSQIPPLKWLLIPGAIVLFVLGVWNGFKFFLSIKSRT